MENAYISVREGANLPWYAASNLRDGSCITLGIAFEAMASHESKKDGGR